MMTRTVILLITALALTGCAVAESAFGTGEAMVVSVTHDNKGCFVTFRVKGKKQLYMSEAKSFSSEKSCKRLSPGMTVPVVENPIYGDYPYVPFWHTGANP
jgi:hypothetical protein